MKKLLMSTVILVALVIGTACNMQRIRTVNVAKVPVWVSIAADAIGTAGDFINFALQIGGGDGFWPTSIGTK